MNRRVAIVGAGWAGLAAAVAATQRGHAVTVFEAARSLGGRARSLELTLPDGREVLVDNGQHILIGAYVDTLRLMQAVGVDPDAAFLRLPLAMRDPRGNGLALPDWPAPWDAAAGILSARGWDWGDKFSLLRAALAWRLAGFRCDPKLTVAELARAVTPRVKADLIEPLCVSALNTPVDRASAEVFLCVLRDGLFGSGHGAWAASNLLLPRQDLGRVFPQAAGDWLRANGAQVRTGARVQRVARTQAGWELDGDAFDAVVLATPSLDAARLVAECGVTADAWVDAARSLEFEAIATVYACGGPRLAQPLLALRPGPGAPAQFVFDRGQLGGPQGLLAFVVSASPRDKEALQAEVLAQAAGLGWTLQPVQTVVEKRATFACVPGLRRPPAAIAPGLWACGDYIAGPYPATLEGAVRSGLAVAQGLA